MTWRIAEGRALALLSAGALNWSYFVQHGAASGLPPLTLRKPLRSLATLFGNGRWLMGFCTGIGGWALYVAALALAPLSLVQASSAGGLGVLAALTGVSSRRERLAVGTAIAGLALLGVSLAGSSETASHASLAGAAIWMGASVLAAAVAAGPAANLIARGAGLGIAAGVLYAAGDVGTKAAVAAHSSTYQTPPLAAFTQTDQGSGGVTVWSGRIANPFVPSDVRPTEIYLPPRYSASQHYPVLYLLHGFWGAPSSFVVSLKLADVADSLIQSGAARPFIAVMPPGGLPVGTKKQRTGSEWAGVWEDYVVRTVVP